MNIQHSTFNVQPRNLLAGLGLALCLCFMPGCATTTAPPTRAAIVFYTFRDTWTTTYAAYTAYAELAVQGKVALRDQQDIDAAWNQFRAVFKASFNLATQDWSAATPDSVQLAANDLLTLIRSL